MTKATKQTETKQTSMSDNPDYGFSMKPNTYTHENGDEKTSYKMLKFTAKGQVEFLKDRYTYVGYPGNNGLIHFYKRFKGETGMFDTL